MAGWHHPLNGHESGWTPGACDVQGGLMCCNSWGHKESDTTEWLNWTEHIYMEFRKMVMITLYERQQKRHRCIEQSFGLFWERARAGWYGRMALKHVNYHMWNEPPVQVWCMIQVLGAGALGWPRGMGWGGRWEGRSGWGTHVYQWHIQVNVWQKQYNIVK